MVMVTNNSNQVNYDPDTGRYYTGQDSIFGTSRTYLDGKGPSNSSSANIPNQVTPQSFTNVNDLYQRYLGRTPSAQEIAAWNAQFNIPEAPKPINSVADLYRNILGREPDAEGLANWQGIFGDTVDQGEIDRFIETAKKTGENINPSYTATPTSLTQEQINQFQQAAKPELQSLSQTPGYRPSSMMDQWYQPVYQPQYTNYTQPGYSLYGQNDPTFSSLANQYFSNAMNMPYAQNNYPINMGLAQSYLNNYTSPNMGGISNLMSSFGASPYNTQTSPYATQSSPYATPVTLQGRNEKINALSPKFGRPSTGQGQIPTGAYTAMTGLKK